jgi:hypothetical protein
VNGLSDRPDLGARACAQPIVVMLQDFDQGLEVANPRPQSSALQNKPIIPVNSRAQQRLGHTNSDEDPSRMRRAMDI